VLWAAASCLCCRAQEGLLAPDGPCCQDVVFVANGAGDFRKASENIARTAAEDHLPLDTVTFCWSHGYGRILSDQLDHAHACAAGKCLAQLALAHRQACPHGSISLLGHCAGCAVVLAAAEAAPPGVVDRVILLAPSVTRNYDLRPALCHTRLGIDVFSSYADRWCLGWGMVLISTCECHCCRAAGRNGFRPFIQSAEDAACYARLRQHPWNRSLACTGHKGGHYGTYQPGFLRAFVLPLLTGSDKTGTGLLKLQSPVPVLSDPVTEKGG